MCPHDVYDWWVEQLRPDPEAFWPVVDTRDRPARHHDGQRGLVSGERPRAGHERRRGRLSRLYPHPATGNEFFEIQSRARALDNNMYVVAPNMGTYYLLPDRRAPIDTFGGRSFIIDYRGRIVGRQDYGGGSTYVGGVDRHRGAAPPPRARQWDNWMKDLRTELYQMVYEQPIYPENLYPERKPYDHETYAREVNRPQVEAMHERGIWAPPGPPRRGLNAPRRRRVRPCRACARPVALQPVVLDLEEEAIDCVVESVSATETTIAPVVAADAAYIPSLGRAAALVFGSGAGRGRAAGAVHRGARAGCDSWPAPAGTCPPAVRRRAPGSAEVVVVARRRRRLAAADDERRQPRRPRHPHRGVGPGARGRRERRDRVARGGRHPRDGARAARRRRRGRPRVRRHRGTDRGRLAAFLIASRATHRL